MARIILFPNSRPAQKQPAPAIRPPDPAEGWRYRYEPATRFIGAYHDKGGAVSICQFPNDEIGASLGPAIAGMLNGSKREV